MLIQSITGSSNQDTEAPTSRVIQPLTSKSTNNPGYVAPKVNPVRQIQAPKQGFKIGDIIPTIGQIAGNAVTEVEHIFKPVTLSNGIKLSTPQVKPGNAVMSIKPDLGNGTSQPSAQPTVTKKSLNNQQQFVNTLNNSQTLQQIKQVVKDVKIDPLALKDNPKKAFVTTWNTFVNSFNEEEKRAAALGFALKNSKSNSEKLGKAGEAVTGFGNFALTLLGGEFLTGATKTPIIGKMAQLLTVPITALGEGGAAITNEMLNETPNSIISTKAKENIRQTVKEVGSLIAQFVVLGKAGEAMGLTPEARGELIDKVGVDKAVATEKLAQEIATKQLSQLKPGENTPQDIINHVINNKLESTTDGKAMLKTAMEAQKEGLNINIESPEASKTVYTGRAVGEVPGTTKPDLTYYTENPKEAAKYAEMNKTVTGVSEVASKDLNGLTLKEIPKTALQDSISSADIRQNYDGVKFLDDKGDMNYAVFDKSPRQQALVDLKNTPSEADHILNPIIDQVSAIIKTNEQKAITEGQGQETQLSQTETATAGQNGETTQIGNGQIAENSQRSQSTQSPSEGKPTINAHEGGNRESAGASTTEIHDTTKQSDTASNPGGNGESLKASKIGKSIEQKAVDAKLTERFSETAGYTTIKIKEQAERATTLVNKNFDEARAIVRGDKPLPDNLKGTALITAMEEHIKQNPSTDLAYELANSPLISSTSEAAQELRLAAEREPDSATAKLQEIKQAREKAITEKNGKTIKEATTDTIKEIKNEIKKQAPSKYDWSNFIKEIQC